MIIQCIYDPLLSKGHIPIINHNEQHIRMKGILENFWGSHKDNLFLMLLI